MTALGAVLGLDIGGSKTHAALVAGPGAAAREAWAGSANVASVGDAEAGRQLDLLLNQLGRPSVAAVCAGAAGVDTPERAARLHRLLRDRLPTARVRVVHDTELILAAEALADGVVLIAGTGSVAWGRRGGREARAGGWGYLLGDEGSGYWFAREAVRHALGLVDAGAEPDRLARRLAEECGLRAPGELLEHFYAQPLRAYWAARAGLVCALAGEGDEVAERLVATGAGALAELAELVCRRLELTGPVLLAGGLVLNQDALASQLQRRLAGRGIPDVRRLGQDPVHGAVALAHKLLSGTGAEEAAPTSNDRGPT